MKRRKKYVNGYAPSTVANADKVTKAADLTAGISTAIAGSGAVGSKGQRNLGMLTDIASMTGNIAGAFAKYGLNNKKKGKKKGKKKVSFKK